MKALKWIDENLELIVMGIALGAIVIVVFVDIVLRNVTGSGLVWAQELSQKCEIVLAAMGISYGVVSEKHIKVDIVPTFFPGTKKHLEHFGDLATFCFCAFMAWHAVAKLKGTLASGAVTAILEIPTFYIYLVMELGLVFACIRMAEKYIKKVLLKNNGKESAA